MPVPDFSPGEVLTAAAMDSIGLWKIASLDYSSASAPEILGCFSNTYKNYRVIISHIGTANVPFRFRMMIGATVEATGVYFGYGSSYSGGATDIGAVAATTQRCGGHSNVGPFPCLTTMDFSNPFISGLRTQTTIHAFDASGPSVLLIGSQVVTLTSYTGIRIIPDSGTITGNMTVYGYRN